MEEAVTAGVRRRHPQRSRQHHRNHTLARQSGLPAGRNSRRAAVEKASHRRRDSGRRRRLCHLPDRMDDFQGYDLRVTNPVKLRVSALPTRANPAPPHAPVAAHRDIAAGGRSDSGSTE
jgi:hypothetical protein